MLKSLVVFDDKGGVGGLDLPNREPLAETFRNAAVHRRGFGLEREPHCRAARGGGGGWRTPTRFAGRIVSVDDEQQTTPDGRMLTLRHRVAVMSEKGLEHFVLEDADAIKFIDPALEAEINRR